MVPSCKRSIKVLFNPSAGNLRGLSRESIAFCLKKQNVPYEWVTLSDLKKMARQSDSSQFVLIIGGDGTIHKVLNSIGHRNLDRFTFGIIPTGTGNDFARSLNIPLNPEQAFELLSTGSLNAIDLGLLNGRICFTCAISLGFGPEVTKNAIRPLKYLFGKGALYLGALLYMIRPKPLYKISPWIDRKPVQQFKTPHLVIGNGKYHGGGFPITPQSDLQNAHFDLYFFTPVPLLQIPMLFYKVFFRNRHHTLLEEVTHQQIQEIQMALNEPLDVDIDGDIYRLYHQIHAKVHPGSLRILGPASATSQDKPIQDAAWEFVGRDSRAS